MTTETSTETSTEIPVDIKYRNKIILRIQKILVQYYPLTTGNIEYFFNNGDTVLIKTIKSKNLFFIRNIIQYTKLHNNKNYKNHTALMYVCKYNFFDIVKLLVEKYKVDIFIVTKTKFLKASDIAKKYGNKEIYEYLILQENLKK
jgi:ankyrin repeat protein